MRKISVGDDVAFALIDNEDADKVGMFTWWLEKSRDTFYAYTKNPKNGKTLRMHQVVAGRPPKRYVIDHKNRNGLDNRKSNLRFARRGLNGLNSIRTKGWWLSPKNKYRKYVVERTFAGKKYRAGYFATQTEAEYASKKLLRYLHNLAVKKFSRQVKP